MRQFLAERGHAEYTATRQRRDGEDVAALLEDLGEVVVHRAGDALVLFPAQVAQFADAGRHQVLGGHELRAEGLALGRQLSVGVGLGQQRVKVAVEQGVPVVS